MTMPTRITDGSEPHETVSRQGHSARWTDRQAGTTNLPPIVEDTCPRHNAAVQSHNQAFKIKINSASVLGISSSNPAGCRLELIAMERFS
jgi:hypothetical protein